MEEREPWTTYGITHFPGQTLDIGVAEGRAFDPREGIGTRLRFVSVGGGAGVFSRDGSSWPFRAPAFFLLDERETVSIDCSDASGNRFVYFHPAVIRGDIGFDTIRARRAPDASVDLIRDLYWLKPFVDRSRPAAGMCFPDRALEHRVAELTARLAEEAATQATNYWPCRMRSFLIETLFSVVQGTELREPEAPFADGDDELLRRFLVEVGSRYAERLTVDGLARDLGTNRTSLQALVGSALGKTVADYVASVRLDAARALLAETYLPVNEIADRSGYENASAFSRAFRQGFGVAPSDFRKAYRDALPVT